MIDPWADFLVAQVGASAALLGLVFVGISINLQKILSIGPLPDRALRAMGLLLAVVIVSSVLLIPGQPVSLMGLEILIVGFAIWGGGTILEIQDSRDAPADRPPMFFSNSILFQAATLPYLAAGGLMLMGDARGLYWLAAAVLLSVAKATLDAWVLLVEINR